MPPPIANGNWTIPNGVLFNATSFFKCDKGFKLSSGGDSAMSICKYDGNWTATGLQCKLREYPIPVETHYVKKSHFVII